MHLYSKIRAEGQVHTTEFIAQDFLPTQTTEPHDCRALAAICILSGMMVSARSRLFRPRSVPAKRHCQTVNKWAHLRQRRLANPRGTIYLSHFSTRDTNRRIVLTRSFQFSALQEGIKALESRWDWPSWGRGNVLERLGGRHCGKTVLQFLARSEPGVWKAHTSRRWREVVAIRAGHI